MKVLVTGGAGFIGSHIVDKLLINGHSPFVIDNFSTGSRANLPVSVPVYEADLLDRNRITQIFDEIQPDAVSHQAAQVSVSRSMREPAFDAQVNVVGLLNVLDNAVRVGTRKIVFASSGGVLYGEVTFPATEDFPKRPMSPYGITKWVGEQYLEFYAREHGIQGIALRYSNVYGPRQNPHGEAGVVAIFTSSMLSGSAPTINGDGKYVRDYVFGPDVAQANVAALESTFENHFTAMNIGTGIGIDVNELAAQLSHEAESYLRKMGNPRRIEPCRYGEPRSGDLRSNLVSPEQAKRLIGWRPKTSLDQGLLQTVHWFGENSAG
jgi:UDP-glucose 4-epimerase